MDTFVKCLKVWLAYLMSDKDQKVLDITPLSLYNGTINDEKSEKL